MAIIRIRNPLGLSDRCGVKTARNGWGGVVDVVSFIGQP
jgi:hypothetical protein